MHVLVWLLQADTGACVSVVTPVLVWLLQADTGTYVSVVTPGRHRCMC